MEPNIAVIGAGYVGLPLAVAFAEASPYPESDEVSRDVFAEIH